MVVSLAQTQLFLLALTRILAMIIHVPALGGQTIPNQVRLGLGIFLTIIILPWQPLPANAETIAFVSFAIKIAQEILIGTLSGFAAALTFGSLQIAGETMSFGSGFSSGRILNPASGESGSAMDQLFVMVAMLLFLVISGHHVFLMGLARSFTLIPINSPLPDFSADRLLLMFAQLVTVGIQIALPVMGALLLTDLTLGLLARVAPQVQVFFLGLPLKIGVGLIVLGLTFATALPFISDLFRNVGDRMLHLLGA